jgi:hypothetical protein
VAERDATMAVCAFLDALDLDPKSVSSIEIKPDGVTVWMWERAPDNAIALDGSGPIVRVGVDYTMNLRKVGDLRRHNGDASP